MTYAALGHLPAGAKKPCFMDYMAIAFNKGQVMGPEGIIHNIQVDFEQVKRFRRKFDKFMAKDAKEAKGVVVRVSKGVTNAVESNSGGTSKAEGKAKEEREKR